MVKACTVRILISVDPSAHCVTVTLSAQAGNVSHRPITGTLSQRYDVLNAYPFDTSVQGKHLAEWCVFKVVVFVVFEPID